MSQVVQILVAGGVLLVMLLVAGAVWKWLRRRLSEPIEPIGSGFTIDELERLRRQGTISDEEFQRLRRQTMGLGPPAGGQGLTRGGANDDERADGRS